MDDDKQYESPPRGRDYEQSNTNNIEEATSPLSSSPSQGNNNNNSNTLFHSPQIISNQIQLQRTDSTGQQDSYSQSDNALLLEPSITPVLNGENIVLLSMSNDNTPVTDNNTDNNHIGDVALGVEYGQNQPESPPPDSVHSGLLTTLSPPPLSQGSAPTPHYTERTSTGGMFSSNGSQGMFSKGDLHHSTVHSQTNQSHNASSINRKKRPPLPPRGAFPGISVAVDVLPLPPPKQIGSVSHRRVVSTGDVSQLSTLTDGDSVADGVLLEESPPASTSGGVPNNPSMFATAAAGAVTTMDHPGMSIGHRQRGISLDGLGIMQPVLSEEDLSKLAMDELDLMQPVLNDDDEGNDDDDDDLNSISKKRSSSPSPRTMASERKISQGGASAALLRMKKAAASERKINQQERSGIKEKSGGWDKLRNHALSHDGDIFQVLSHEGAFLTKKGSGSKFEEEAERAILEALNQFNISPAPSREEPEKVEEEQSPHTPNETIDKVPTHHEVPTHLSSMRVSHLSSVTSEGCNNNSLNIHNLNQKGSVQLFEDQGWHDGYDELGRNKGSLREEQDAKFVEEVTTTGSQIKLAVLDEEEQINAEEPSSPPTQPNHKSFGSIVAGLKNPLHVMRHKKDDDAEETASKKKKDDDYRDEEDDDDDDNNEDEVEPSHKREKTMVSDMTQEMQKFQTAGGMHNRINTHKSKDSHGVDNLFNGADLLFKVEEKKAGKAPKPEQIEEGNEDNDEYYENETGEGDEENPNPQKHKKAHFVGARSQRVQNKSQKFHEWKVWWLDLIKPKVRDDMLILIECNHITSHLLLLTFHYRLLYCIIDT